jgi:hypothetical protein
VAAKILSPTAIASASPESRASIPALTRSGADVLRFASKARPCRAESSESRDVRLEALEREETVVHYGCVESIDVTLSVSENGEIIVD